MLIRLDRNVLNLDDIDLREAVRKAFFLERSLDLLDNELGRLDEMLISLEDDLFALREQTESVHNQLNDVIEGFRDAL
jgi:hypothetical protein